MKVADLFEHAWTLTALAIALERRDVDGEVERAAREVVAAAGMSDLLGGPRAALLRADLRSTLGTLARVARGAQDPAIALAGWGGDDPVQVEAQGVVSQVATEGMIAFLRKLPGLPERLVGGGRVLDVGAGAAGLCIALARAFPEVHVVGVEISPTAVAVARAKVAEAGLADRIEMREHGGEALTDRDTYDLAYVAQMFIPDAAIDAVLAATARALRSGGYLITASVSAPGDDVPASVARLRNAVWGGGVRFAADVIARLGAAGLTGAMPGPRPPGSTLTPILARRPS